MPKVYHVKNARKDNSVAKKGESYYWWKFRYGGKHYSKTRPKASQLTQSDFLSRAYELNERIEDLEVDSIEDLRCEIEDIANEFRTLGEESYDNLSNMPDHLQESSSAGMLLQERSDRCEEIADELENIDTDIDEDAIKEEVQAELGEDAKKDEIEDEIKDRKQDRFEEVLQEVQSIQYDGD